MVPDSCPLKEWFTKLVWCLLIVFVCSAQVVGYEPGSKGKDSRSSLHATPQIDAAAHHFRAAIMQNPGVPSNYENLFQALFLDDRREELVYWLRMFEARFPEQSETCWFHFNMAMTLYGLQAHEESLARFMHVISLPYNASRDRRMHAASDFLVRSFHHIGLLLELFGHKQDACRAFWTTLRLKWEGPKYGMYLVTCLLASERVNEAASMHSALLGERSATFPRPGEDIMQFRCHKRSRMNPWHGIVFHLQEGRERVYETKAARAVTDEARTQITEQIHSSQHPVDCSLAKVVVYSMKHAFAGLGAEVHGVVLALNLAHALKRTLVMPERDSWWYSDAAMCEQGGWECHFLPVSPCGVLRRF
eukprot:766373-Hanusia_phi.AAC.8